MEDDPLVATHLEEVLRAAGAAVTTLNSVRQLDAFDPHEVDLAVLDVSLGDGDVGDHLTALSAAGVCLLFHTGTDDMDTMVRAHPGARVLSKPSRESDLLALCVKMMADGA
ncbi:MAG: hypothetical protein AAFX52_01905 [Pseudomonadota bacterium]